MKKGIACVLLSAMVAFGSFAAGCGGNSQEAEKKTFTIAYAPNESTTDSTDARSTLAKDLGKVINMEVKEIQASDYTAIIEALRTGKADMAYMGAFAAAAGTNYRYKLPCGNFQRNIMQRMHVIIIVFIYIYKFQNRFHKTFSRHQAKTY